ACCIS
ncbi:hypothetical protein BV002_01093C, partial [Haemophilus influenzae]